MRSLARVSLLVLSLSTGLAATSHAQQVAEGPPKVQTIRAVERGGFVETDIGFSYLVLKVNDQSYGLGLTTGVFVGYDILDVLSISIGATSMVGAAGVSVGTAPPDKPVGDLFFLIPMLQAQLALLTTERNFVYVKAGAGFSFAVPGQVGSVDFGGNGPAFEGLVGYEHYTRLRHFSIGISAGVMVVTKPAVGIGITALPTLKYTF